MACFSTARRFPAISPAAFDTPVTEPPGRFRFGTNPEPTGSPTSAITIGMFVLVSMAAFGKSGADQHLTVEWSQVSYIAGSMPGDTLTFEATSQETSSSMRFSLKVQGERMQGDMKGSADGNDIVGKVSFSKAK